VLIYSEPPELTPDRARRQRKLTPADLDELLAGWLVLQAKQEGVAVKTPALSHVAAESEHLADRLEDRLLKERDVAEEPPEIAQHLRQLAALSEQPNHVIRPGRQA
jgi:hypothetical protein